MNNTHCISRSILYIIIMFISSCSNPLAINEVKAITKEPEKEFLMKPIKVYEKYAVDENCKVSGIIGNSLEAVVLKDDEGVIHAFNDFFTINDSIYFSVNAMEEETEVHRYYQQTDVALAEIDEGSYPDKPEKSRVTMAEGNFKIEDYLYNGDTLSKVFRGNEPIGYYIIDGAFMTEKGLWYHSKIDTGTRKKGLYFYSKDTKIQTRLIAVADIW